MTIEAENAVLDVVSKLGGHPDEPMITRDARKRATLKHFPTIFVLEGLDEVKHVWRNKVIENDREGIITTVSYIQASSGEAAAGELSGFEQEIRKAIYGDAEKKVGQIGDYGAAIREIGASEKFFPPLGNSVIARALVWRIAYRELVSRVFVLPTT
jgi:hypothetical protein